MSKTLNLEFVTDDLALKPEAGVVPTAIELSKRIIVIAVRQYADQHQGLLKVERKQSKWLYDELEKAAAIEMKTLDIPDDIFGFLRKVFRETKLPVMDKILDRVESNIDAVMME